MVVAKSVEVEVEQPFAGQRGGVVRASRSKIESIYSLQGIVRLI
jgi:hypothetical protein